MRCDACGRSRFCPARDQHRRGRGGTRKAGISESGFPVHRHKSKSRSGPRFILPSVPASRYTLSSQLARAASGLSFLISFRRVFTVSGLSGSQSDLIPVDAWAWTVDPVRGTRRTPPYPPPPGPFSRLVYFISLCSRMVLYICGSRTLLSISSHFIIKR